MTFDVVDAGDPARIADGLVAAFRAAYDRAPDGVFAAPGRVNLIGEHTDYNEGLCLPVALPHATYVAAASRADGRLRVASTQRDGAFEADVADVGPGRVDGWAAYVAGVVWALRERGVDVPGLDLLVDSTVPIGAGLSSSAAIECATALATCAAAGLADDEERRRSLIDVCIRAEQEVAGAPTGGMDQTISLLGAADHALVIDCRDGATTQLRWPTAEATLVVVDTRSEHALVDGQYGSRRDECAAAAKALGVGSLREVDDLRRLDALDEPLRRRARHVVTEIARVQVVREALAAGDLAAVGRAFLESHASMRDDFEISTPELDLVVTAAVDAGALGARMTGGGFGGSAVVLTEPADAERVAEAVGDAFAAASHAAPGVLLVEPAAGARRVL